MTAGRRGLAGLLLTTENWLLATDNRLDSACLSRGLFLQYGHGFAGHHALRDEEKAMVDTLCASNLWCYAKARAIRERGPASVSLSGENDMVKCDQEAREWSWPGLTLCLLIVCGGTAGAVYLFWRIHWVAAAVVAVPIWILLVDLFVNGRKSISWYLLDFLRHTLTFAGTAAVVWYLWKVDWRIAAAAVLPVFVLILNIVGFSTLRVYDITPEANAARRARESMERLNRGS